jgi:ferritin-like metal-binding protein YciE
VAESAARLLSRYLDDAIAAERSFETQLRSFAEQGDDDEVQSAFLTHAGQTRTQHERLARRLEQLGGSPSTSKALLAGLYEMGPKLSQAGHVPEERITQNLIAAFTIETGECALYEALATLAAAAGDPQTERLAREIQAEEQHAAELIFRFIPSRSKIAFNVVTPHEIDPAIDTKAPDDRILS